MDDQNLRPVWIVILFGFYCNTIKVNHVLHCDISFLHLIFLFLHIKSLFVSYTDVSTVSVDFILLSSLALNVILSTSSVYTLCFLLLDLCCDSNINQLFLMSL